MNNLNHINPIIKLTDGCNYNCYFCRYANNKRKDKGIDEGLIVKMVSECIRFNREYEKNKINVIFHGGEPLLYGAKRLLTVIEDIQQKKGDDFVVDYSIQTNGSLITDEWVDIFKKYHFDVGISLDGPVLLNGHWYGDRNKSVEEAVSKYHMLRDKGVRCGILSVITNKHLLHLNEFFDFFVENEIDSIGLCFCYSKFDDYNVNPTQLGEWLIQLYDLYFNSPYKINIREFDNATRRIIKNYKKICESFCRTNCGSYLTVHPNGRVDFCDDYEKNEEYPLGNINESSLYDILKGTQYKTQRLNAFSIVEEKCTFCEVKCICRGGCARNDSYGYNYFCDTYKKIYPYIQQNVLSYIANRKIDV